jgi:hypothetical protein
LKRLAGAFDVWSDHNGTVLLAEVESGRTTPSRFHVRGIRVPKTGETECGDNWTSRPVGNGFAVLVADGLGHGPLAAAASREAAAAFQRTEWYGVTDVVEQVHAALRATRGAAVAVAHIDVDQRVVNFAGLGNITGQLLRPQSMQHMVSHNGTAGHTAPRISHFQYPWDPNSSLLMYSDGLLTQWSAERYPGVLMHDPGMLAGLLYRDYSRRRDDVGVVVAREA